MKKKVWIILGVLAVLILLFTVFLSNRTLDDLLSDEHHYTNSGVSLNSLFFESITYYELEEVSENGEVNLEEEHTFEVENGNVFSYKYLEDRGEYLVLKIVLNHNYLADTNKFIVPSEIINQNGNWKYTKPFQFKVVDSNGDNTVIEIKDVAFGECEILIDKDKALKSQRLDIYLDNYRYLVVN